MSEQVWDRFAEAVLAVIMNTAALCSNPDHGYGEHSADCVPDAEPHNPALRVLRVIFGLCPDCNETDPHEHGETTCGSCDELHPDGACYEAAAARRRHREACSKGEDIYCPFSGGGVCTGGCPSQQERACINGTG